MLTLAFCGFSVYGRGRKLDKAVGMFNAARSSGLSPDEKAYTNLISCYGKAGIILFQIQSNNPVNKLHINHH